jgi:hypothetical protein
MQRGMEQKGLVNLLAFVDKGGKVISWGRSTDIFMGNLSIERRKMAKQEFSLPVTNIGEPANRSGTGCYRVISSCNPAARPSPYPMECRSRQEYFTAEILFLPQAFPILTWTEG